VPFSGGVNGFGQDVLRSLSGGRESSDKGVGKATGDQKKGPITPREYRSNAPMGNAVGLFSGAKERGVQITRLAPQKDQRGGKQERLFLFKCEAVIQIASH